jgi:hypothetical protein
MKGITMTASRKTVYLLTKALNENCRGYKYFKKKSPPSAKRLLSEHVSVTDLRKLDEETLEKLIKLIEKDYQGEMVIYETYEAIKAEIDSRQIRELPFLDIYRTYVIEVQSLSLGNAKIEPNDIYKVFPTSLDDYTKDKEVIADADKFEKEQKEGFTNPRSNLSMGKSKIILSELFKEKTTDDKYSTESISQSKRSKGQGL